MKVCVTGANGFIGSALCKYLAKQNYEIIGLVNSKKNLNQKNIKFFKVNFFKKDLDLSIILKKVDCIIHCAAKAHSFSKDKKKLLNEINKNNIDLTHILAAQAKKNKVKKFIFISSIGVNGPFTLGSQLFRYDDAPNPNDDYSYSKWKTEQFLKCFFHNALTKVVIIRPPLVYGPGVKGNMLSLLKLLNLGLPLPLGRIHNLKSFLGLSNLLDFIAVCIMHPKASNKTFLISDCEDVSVTEFIKKLLKFMNKKNLLIPAPIFLLTMLGCLLFKKKQIKKLTTSLTICSVFATKTLNWQPKFSLDYDLSKMIKWYLGKK